MTNSPFFHLSVDMMAVSNSAGYLLALNEVWEKALGWSRAELMSRPFVDFVHPDDVQATLLAAAEVTKGTPVSAFENRYRHKDGGYRWLQWNSAFSTEDGLVYSIARDVTQSRRIATLRREVEAATGVGSWEIDLETNDLYWSDITHRIHETDPQTYRPKLEEGIAFYAPEAIPVLSAAVRRQMEDGVGYTLELPFVTARGRRVWVRASSGSEMREGKPIRVFGTFQEITREREEREKLLAYRDIVELAHDGIWVLDADGLTTYANRRMEEMLGLTAGALVGKAMRDFVDPAWRSAAADMFGLPAKSTPNRQDILFRRASGSEFWASISARARLGADGRTLTCIALVSDVTERKRIELELARSRTRLEEAQSIARLGHWEANLKSGELFWSDIVYEIFGLDKAAFQPSVDAFSAAVHPDDLPAVRQSEVRAATTGRHDVQHRIIRPDGSIRWVHEQAVLDTDDAGERVRLIGTVQDITEQKQVELDLESARRMADAANMAKSEFLASMSHELRTPMNGVIGMLGLLQDGPLGERQREYAALARQSAEQLLSVVNDILDFSRAEAGRIDLEIVPCDVGAVLAEVVALLRSQAERQGVDLRAPSIAPGLPQAVLTDPGRLRQVVFNLVGNALKFTREGHVAVRATHRTVGEGQVELRIAVEDTGIGVDPAVGSRLFRPFSQGDSSTARRFGGSGLGLAISQRLVRLMGGDIGFTSEPGRGSTFWFTVLASLPAVALVPCSSVQPLSGPMAMQPAPDARPPIRVLVAEDNHVNQKLIGALLEAQGYRVDIASNGQEAVDAVRAAPYDLVLMDVHMPVMDGLDATRCIRSLPGNLGRMPIVALTADAMHGRDRQYLAAGMTDVAYKPIDRKSLFATIERLTRPQC